MDLTDHDKDAEVNLKGTIFSRNRHEANTYILILERDRIFIASNFNITLVARIVDK